MKLLLLLLASVLLSPSAQPTQEPAGADPDKGSDPTAARATTDGLFRPELRVLHAFDGEAAGDQFGWIGRNVGDADGDGRNDILLSAPTKTVDGPNAGRIYVYSGASGKLLFTKTGAPGSFFGMGIEAAGDVDGDGADDVLVGAPGFGTGKGQAFVFSGKDGRTLLTLDSEQAQDGFGRKVAGTGDLNGDGLPELLVGAPQHDAGGQDTGRAYLFSGKDGSLLQTLDGEEPGDAFGVGINALRREGGKAFVIGAGNAGEGDRGRAYVFRYDEGRAQLAFTIDADETGSNLGHMFLSFVGDLDADGEVDVYASDWQNNALGQSTGRIYVHSGRTGERLLTLTGEKAGDGFGIGTAEAGDANGDGHDDLLIGAWQNGEGAPGAGKCYLYSGKDGDLLESWVCTAAGDTFGFDTTTLGDVDGDGGPDYLVTSAWSAVSGAKTGRAFVIGGRPLAEEKREN